MVPIAYASSEGSDEPGHQWKIASALTAHIHMMKVHAKLESRNSLYLPHVRRCMYASFVTWEDQSAHRTVFTAPLFLEQHIKHFVGSDLGQNCLLN